VRADPRRIRVRNNKKRPSLTSRASREDACLVDLSTIETRRFVRKDGSSASSSLIDDERDERTIPRVERRRERGKGRERGEKEKERKTKILLIFSIRPHTRRRRKRRRKKKKKKKEILYKKILM